VVIKNKPFAAKYYGSQIAGPVFKEIADKLFTVDPVLYANYRHTRYADSSKASWKGADPDFRLIAKAVNIKVTDSGKVRGYATMAVSQQAYVAHDHGVQKHSMPDLIGFGLKDALGVLEKQQLQVIATGKGKVTAQSILPGTAIQKGQTIYLTLGNPVN
jgi:cell division protein FtsI (penicillin-binding protein 3)